MAVRAAQQALEQEASKAEAVNDPTGPTLRALSLAVGACHKLYVDGSMTIGSLIETTRQPVAPDDMRLAVAQGIRASASGAVRALNIRNVLIASSVLVGSNVLTAATVYWWAATNLQATVASLDVRLSASASQRWRSLIEANPGDLIDKRTWALQCAERRDWRANSIYGRPLPHRNQSDVGRIAHATMKCDRNGALRGLNRR